MVSSKYRVLVTASRLSAKAVAKLEQAGAELEFTPDALAENQLVEIAARRPLTAILMRNNPPIGRALFAVTPDLRVIAKHGAGYNSIDLEAATQAGVPVLVAAGANAYSVAEHAVALMMALGRDVVRLDQRVKSGHWDKWSYSGREMRGRELGLVGFGAIGRIVARLAGALGMRVCAFSRRLDGIDPTLARPVGSLDEVFQDSDIVNLHCPLTPTTRFLVNPERLASMRPGALLINTARGELVDETALAAALHSGHLGGAALDTFAVEPTPRDNPLLSAPNLIVAPHIGAHTASAEEEMGMMAADNILAVLSGDVWPRANLVNPDLLKLG